jgi:DNA-binding NtrC family response regulator
METFQKSHPIFPILLVDDEIHALEVYEMQLLRERITNLISCQSGKEALNVLSAQEISIIVLDLYMPQMSGEEVLSMVANRYPEVPVIVTTAIDDVDTVVRCMKAGAFDYIVKPVQSARLITTVRRALEFRELRRENILLKESVFEDKLKHPEAFSEMITNNKTMRSIFKYIESIAMTSQPVLITGETGVGKELIAQAVHCLSGRRGSLVAVNVAGLDDTTFSDTLFGHKRGAFTGADRLRHGLIEKAADGTLFLDEIGDLHPASQVKLLRLLQEREYYPLGADVPKLTNARIIVATNHDLAALQEAEKFRADLYYRLLLHRINVPPLRERRDDIPLLVDHFLQSAADELGKTKPTPPPELFTLLSLYDFPGNVRELKAMIFDAVSRHESRKLSLTSFEEIIQSPLFSENSESMLRISTLEALYTSLERLPGLKEAERLLIQEALRRTDGNQTLAAGLLGITRQTLHRRLLRISKNFS